MHLDLTLEQINVIVSVDWCVTATDESGDITAYRYGGPVQLGAPSSAAFTPFEKVTLADVVGWYQEVLGKEQIEALTKGMDDEIEAQIKAANDPSTPAPMALEQMVVTAVMASSSSMNFIKANP